MKKTRKTAYKSTCFEKALWWATTTSKDWGFIPVPGKGGNTTNAEIPEWMFQRELNDMMEGGAVNA